MLLESFRLDIYPLECLRPLRCWIKRPIFLRNKDRFCDVIRARDSPLVRYTDCLVYRYSLNIWIKRKTELQSSSTGGNDPRGCWNSITGSLYSLYTRTRVFQSRGFTYNPPDSFCTFFFFNRSRHFLFLIKKSFQKGIYIKLTYIRLNKTLNWNHIKGLLTYIYKKRFNFKKKIYPSSTILFTYIVWGPLIRFIRMESLYIHMLTLAAGLV